MFALVLRWLPRLIELDILLLIAISPWLFGGAESFSFFAITSTLSIGLLLWAARVLLEWRFAPRNSPVLWCLVALIAFGMWQAVRLPKSVLAVISPHTSAFYDKLLPTSEERVGAETPSQGNATPNGATISFYPWESIKAGSDLLAVLALFALIQNNIATIGFLRRLSILTLFNSALLALFAIIQFYSSPHDHIFWKIPIRAGQVFGTFICRNHFSFYTNISTGLSLGLLFAALPGGAKPNSRSRRRTSSRSINAQTNPGLSVFTLARRVLEAATGTFHLIFSHPAFLWICSGVALVVAATVLSSSRGGLLSLSISLALLFVLRRILQPNSKGLAPVILLAAIGATAFFAWLGPGRIDHYIAGRWSGHNLDDRLPLWKAAWPLVGEYPLLGTGYGTFQYVEPLHRGAGSESLRSFTFEHAHNEYLEALVEGGTVRLFITCLAIFLVYKLGFENVRRLGDTPDSGLVTGALCGFTTVVIHSAGDFGLHIPAIAILTTTIAALLATPLGSHFPARLLRAPAKKQGSRMFLNAWGPLVGALGLVSIALLLSVDVYGRHLSQLYRAAAFRTQRQDGSDERQIEYLKGVTQLSPGSAEAQQELGQKYLDVYEAKLANEEQLLALELACRTLLIPASANGGFEAYLITTICGCADDLMRTRSEVEAELLLERTYAAPALHHFIKARDLCPLLVRPHLRLAAYHHLLEGGGTSGQYWERAKLIAIQDPELWFSSGVFNLARGDQKEAWSDFRESLHWSNRFLSEILGQAKRQLSSREILEQVLPDDADTQLAAYQFLFVDPADPNRKAFLTEMLRRIERGATSTTGRTQRIKGLVLHALGRSDDAITAYRIALSLNADNHELRSEFAELLLTLNRKQEARNELALVLAHDPSNARAKTLLETSAIPASPRQISPQPSIKGH